MMLIIGRGWMMKKEAISAEETHKRESKRRQIY